MNRLLLFSLMISLSLSICFAQNLTPKSEILMKNGAVFKGEILMTTDEVIVMQTDDGKRYQFQISEISRIDQERKRIEKIDSDKENNFSGILEINAGFTNTPVDAIQSAPAFSSSVALGTRDFLKTKTFAGIGTGIDFIFLKSNHENLAFIPLFLQINKTLLKNKISPFVGAKSGYSFCLNENYKGSTFIQIAGGVNFNIAENKSLNLGVFGKAQEISGTVIEKNEFGTFTKQGTGTITFYGVNLAFLF